MWIVPFFLGYQAQATAKFPLQCIWVFLSEGGTEVWQIDDSPTQALSPEDIYTEHCVSNGLIGTPFYSSSKNTLFVEINKEKTNINDFYSWNDFFSKGQQPPKELDVWRPFFWLGETSDTDMFGWKSIAARQSLGTTGFGSIADIWEAVSKFLPPATRS